MNASLIFNRAFTVADLVSAMRVLPSVGGILADARAFNHAASIGVKTGTASFETNVMGLKVLIFNRQPMWIETALKVEPRDDVPEVEEVLRFLVLGRAVHDEFIARRAEAWAWREQYDAPLDDANAFLAVKGQFEADFPERRFGGTHGLNVKGVADLVSNDTVLDVKFLIPKSGPDDFAGLAAQTFNER
uniref:Uncharacterized protein n=1 Tax=Caulobacter phage BL57 TaxID=3348355 RepID=A0AB74UKP6_9VIRU